MFYNKGCHKCHPCFFMEHVFALHESSVYLSRFYKEKLRLKRLLFIWIWICFLFSFVQKAGAERVSYPVDKHVSSADSIMEKVIFFAPPFMNVLLKVYKAELYIKGWVNIRKKNHILRYIPSMFRPKKRGAGIYDGNL